MIYNKEEAAKTASLLLQINAIRLNLHKPYVWASGWRSPIYCDNRQTLSYPEIRTFIKESFLNLIQNVFPEVELIAGVSTAGIPHGVLLADALELPFVYVRSAPKSHGLENLVEGKVLPGQKALVIEDLISTGGSSLKVVEALRAEGVIVLGLAAIFTYGFLQAEANFKNAQCICYTLSDYSFLLDEALKQGSIKSDELSQLNEWRMTPDKWGV